MRISSSIRLLSVAAACLLLTLLMGTPLQAQIDTGRILGTVRDQSGAAIPGAKVTLTNTGTGLSLVDTTGTTGNYSFPVLKAGTYQIEIEVTNFSKFLQTPIPLHIQQEIVLDATLVPGKVTQTVEVKGAPPLLQTQNASLGQTVDTSLVNDLPLNGRNWTVLAQLAPGAVRDASQSANRAYFSSNGHPLEQNDYRLNGINNNDEVWTYPQPYNALPPPDAIQEFKVETSNYSAEFGHSAGAVVNAITKSGTNRFHGDLWEFVRNSEFDAATFFQNSGGLPKAPYRLNQFGATVGGPVEIPRLYNGKDKTFFFADFQLFRLRTPIDYVDTVPTSTMRSSGYTNLQDLITYQSGTRTDDLGRVTPLGTVFDPATTRSVTKGIVDPVTGLTATASGYVRDPFYQGSLVGLTGFTSSAVKANLNLLPANRLDPNAIKLLSLDPVPNMPGFANNYTYDPTKTDDTNQFDFRVDHNFSARDQMFVMGSHYRENIFTPGGIPGLVGSTNNTGKDADAYAVSETHIFSPTLLNEARLGWSRSPIYIVPTLYNVMGVPEEFGIQGVPQVPGNGGLNGIAIAGMTGMGTGGHDYEVSAPWDVTENLTKVHGVHTFKAGFEGTYISAPISFPTYQHGSLSFSGNYTEVPTTTGGGTGMAQLLLTPTASSVPGGFANVGGPDNVSLSNIVAVALRRRYYGFYLQDAWKATSKLTLTLGLRWDYFTPYYEAFGALANFVPGPPGNGAEYLIANRRCNDLRSASFNALTQKDGIAVQCSGLGNMPNTNFAPRLGIAYWATPKLVARAGYGIFYGALGTEGGNPLLYNNYPFAFGFSYNYTDPAHPITLPNGSQATLETALSGINLSPGAVNAQGVVLNGRQYNSQTPYFEDYNFSLQYMLGPNQTLQLAYVGNQGHHMGVMEEDNGPSVILPPGLVTQSYVPFPDFARGVYATGAYESTSANSYYNSLQASFDRRFSGGLELLAGYTYSKCRSDWRSPALTTIGTYRAPWLPGFGIQGDYSLCNSDVPNVLHFSGLYSLPFGNGRRFLAHSPGLVNAVLGGWQTNWILNLQDGYPFNVTCPVSATADYGCWALLVPGQNIYAGQHDVNQWLNPAAFAAPPKATAIGQSDFAPLGGAPTQAHGPGEHNLDFSVFKEFPVAESKRFEFRAEFFNLANTPWFNNPSSLDFTNTKLFGKITSIQTNSNARQIQLGLKFYW